MDCNHSFLEDGGGTEKGHLLLWADIQNEKWTTGVASDEDKGRLQYTGPSFSLNAYMSYGLGFELGLGFPYHVLNYVMDPYILQLSWW